MKRLRLIGGCCLLACLAARGASLPGPEGSGLIALPVLAVVTGTESKDGKTWMQEGIMGGTLEVACRDFRQALRAAGWRVDKTMVMGKPGQRSELAIWLRRGQRVLVMITEREPGLCEFTWGEER